MKHILQLIINLVILLFKFVLDIQGVIWFGKLPKVSTYHLIKCYFPITWKQEYTDENIHSKFDVKKHLDLFNAKLCETPSLKKLHLEMELPIYDDCNKEIGTQTLFGVIHDVYRDYLNELY